MKRHSCKPSKIHRQTPIQPQESKQQQAPNTNNMQTKGTPNNVSDSHQTPTDQHKLLTKSSVEKCSLSICDRCWRIQWKTTLVLTRLLTFAHLDCRGLGWLRGLRFHWSLVPLWLHCCCWFSPIIFNTLRCELSQQVVGFGLFVGWFVGQLLGWLWLF
jgi:hypothetical protein